MSIKCLSIVDECFQDYKKASMLISFPKCSGKCWKELGLDKSICHNHNYYDVIPKEYEINDIVSRYINNKVTSALILGGLEPFDSFNEIEELIKSLRKECNDDIVIYTGYYPQEIEHRIKWLSQYSNIIVKFGRYIPNRDSKYDDILGIYLSSDNQYAKKIS